MVHRRCERLLGDPRKAEDAMQDVFVQLLRRKERLDDRALSSLLFRMATGICLNRLRSDRRHPENPVPELLERISNADDPETATVGRQMISRLFGREPVSSRVIAVLHLHDGLTLQEVADETGLSVSGVRKRLRKMRKTLHEISEVA
jgi:RNA polymerase sigma-70 factor (ECF subfamily)